MCGEVECFALHRGNRVRRGQFLLPKLTYCYGDYMGTSLKRTPPPPVGPCSSPMPKGLW